MTSSSGWKLESYRGALFFGIFVFIYLIFLSSPVSDIRDVDAMKPAGEWNGTGGGGCIDRRAGIT